MLPFRSSVFAAALLVGAGSVVGAEPAAAEIAVSANDGKVRMVDGVVQVQKDGRDTITLIDLAATPPKPIGELEVPASVVGPPLSVAIAPNESIALVAAAAKLDPADPTKTVPDDRVTVIDLGGDPSILARVKAATGIAKAEGRKPPSVIATVQAGAGAAGLSINTAGTLALVANRSAGTISILKIDGRTVTNVGTVDLGNPKSGPSHVAFTPDGKQAYVTRDGDNRISVLTVEGTKVEYTKRDLTAGIRPYGLDIARNGQFAVVANIGNSSGDADTMSLIDLTANPSRVVSTVTVGQTPEGIKLSPDSKYVAVNLMGGTNIPTGKPGAGTKGSVQIWSVSGRDMRKVAETPTGGWCQGLAWSRNGRTLLVQCMIEQEIQMYRLTGVTGRSFERIGVIKTTGGPAAIRTAEK